MKLNTTWVKNTNGAYKEQFPYHQVPVLNVDGTQIAQSSAIARYISRKYGFFGANELETAQIDAVWEQVVDIRKNWFVAREKDGGKPGEHQAKFYGTSLPEQFALLDRNTKGDGHFVGNKLSLADVGFYYLIWVFSTENKEAVEGALAKHPKLHKVYTATAGNANIAKWVAERPQTIF